MLALGMALFAFFLSTSARAGESAAAYRAMGPKGVDAAIAAHVSDSDLDQICKQHDCRASKLYWYTDLGQALEESSKQKKPVLSLRLLGKLDEELSCANSRFFRTLLYSDPSIAKVMREKFILHWEAERPAPKITIDFGDGRKIVQTITGNSIHYLLDPNGNVMDALPGLYSPDGFRSALEEFGKLWARIEKLEPGQRREALISYHKEAQQALERQWGDRGSSQLATQSLNVQQSVRPARPPLPAIDSYAGSTGRVLAADAAQLAMAKSVVEARPIRTLQPGNTAERRKLRELMEDPMWPKLAQEHVGEVTLSKESEALVRTKLVYDPSTGLTRSAEEVRKTLGGLRLAVAIDVLRNDFVYRRALHSWLGSTQFGHSVDTFNRRVYESLFLTPGTDPWLGLKPEGVYTGIRGDGISLNASR